MNHQAKGFTTCLGPVSSSCVLCLLCDTSVQEEDCEPDVSESMHDLPDNMAEAWIDVSSQAEHCEADEAEKKAIAKGDRVFVDGRAATVVYGPDIDGEYMVRFDD